MDDDDNRIALKLEHPISAGKDKTITELRFRTLKGKDLRRCKAKDGTPMVLELAGFLSGQPTQVIDELEGEDLLAAMRIVNSFFESSQGTGTEDSPS